MDKITTDIIQDNFASDIRIKSEGFQNSAVEIQAPMKEETVQRKRGKKGALKAKGRPWNIVIMKKAI